MANYTRARVEELLRGRWGEIEFVAEGGNSFVFKVPEEGIAIKALRRGDPPRFERFVREVKVAQHFRDIPGLVAPLDVNLPVRWVEKPDSQEDIALNRPGIAGDSAS